LIVLEIRKRTVQGKRCFASPKQGASDVSRAANKRPASADAPQSLFQFEKTSFASSTSGIFAVRLRSRLVCSRLQVRRWIWNCSQTGRRSQDETGYASSSRCQIFAERPRNRAQGQDIASRLSGLSPPLLEDRRPAEPCGPRGSKRPSN